MAYQPQCTTPIRPKAFLVGCCAMDENISSVNEYLDELTELAKTLDTDVCGRMTVRIREHNPKYFVGSGKAEEISIAADEANADVIIFDDPLGPSQQRNLEKLCKRKVIDRQEIILDIFAARAQTKEAVLQVELARCCYFLPRLTGAWTHLSRQRGGNTGARGEGEKQIEIDRRQLKKRIAELELELAEIRKQRGIQRKERLRNTIPSVAIVGYTNAGKSSLINLLTDSDILAENKLFATLDPTTRRMTLPDKSPVLLTDTVGFIRKLPHSLVEAFKSTLEEAILADFVILLLDVSSAQAPEHWETTISVLNELGAADKTIIPVFNKTDLQPDPFAILKMKSIAPDAVFISCRTGNGIEQLKERLMLQVNTNAEITDIEIPPEQAKLTAFLHDKCCIFQSGYYDNGTFFATVKIPFAYRDIFGPYSKKNQNGAFLKQ